MDEFHPSGIKCCDFRFFDFDDFRDHVDDDHFKKEKKYRCAQCEIQNATTRGHLNKLKSLLNHCRTHHFSCLNFNTRHSLKINSPPHQSENFNFESEEFDIENVVGEEIAEEIQTPKLNDSIEPVDFNQLSIEDKFSISILKIKSITSISFSALLLVVICVLDFIKFLFENGLLTLNMINKLLEIAKSKYNITNRSLKIGDGLHLFKEITLNIKQRDGSLIQSKAYVLNLELALKLYLSIEENVQLLFNCKRKQVHRNVIKTIRETDAFKEDELDCNLFIQIYIDDFDIKSGLNSSSENTKMCGIYMTFANLPYQYQSKRRDQFLLACIKSSDLHNLEDENQFFSAIVDQFNHLYDHPFEFNNGYFCKPVLWSVLADNLESNYLQKLSCSFNSDSCKYCDIRKEQLEYTDSANERIESNHVFKFCRAVVHHLIYSPDIFHDVNEGVILKFFELIYKLNSPLERQKWEINYSNCKQFLKHGTLRNISNGNLSGTGCQKMEFFLILPFLISDQSIFDTTLYSLLRTIIDFCYADEIEIDSLEIFDSKIKEFLHLYRNSIKNYNKNFPFDKTKQIKFTFKLHHLHHYPALIRRFGPLKYSSTIRGERFHQIHKYFIANSKSKVNVPFQITRNWSIFHTMHEFNEQLVYKVSNEFGPDSLYRFSSELKEIIKHQYDPEKPIMTLKEITINNITTEIDKMYLYREKDYNNLPSFVRINLIIKQDQGHLWVTGKLFKSITYNDRYHSFILESTEETVDYDVHNPKSHLKFVCFQYGGRIHLMKHLIY